MITSTGPFFFLPATSLTYPKKAWTTKMVISYHYSHLSLYCIAGRVHVHFCLFLPGQHTVEAMPQWSPGVDLALFVPALSSVPVAWQHFWDFLSSLSTPLLHTAVRLPSASKRKAVSLLCLQKLDHLLAATETWWKSGKRIMRNPWA